MNTIYIYNTNYWNSNKDKFSITQFDAKKSILLKNFDFIREIIFYYLVEMENKDEQELEFPGTWAINEPDRIAVLMSGSDEKMTYLELDEKANRISNLFVGLGLQPGDHIAFCLENTIDFLPLAWGAHYAGLYYTAISSRLTEEEMSYIVKDCGARVFVTSVGNRDTAELLDFLDHCKLMQRSWMYIVLVVRLS